MGCRRASRELEARSVRESPRTVVVAIYRGENLKCIWKSDHVYEFLETAVMYNIMSFRKDQVTYQSDQAKG